MTDDYLAHFGVKGMKWGKRKAEGTSSRQERKAARKKEWEEHDEIVTSARKRQEQRGKDLNTLAAKTYSATTEVGQKRAEAAYNKLAGEMLTGPDAISAQVLTRGERQANIALASIGVTLLAASAALSIAGK